MRYQWKASWSIEGNDFYRDTHKYFATELDAFNYMSTVFDHLAFLGLRDLLVSDSIELVEDNEV